jgi:hypothetical protein
MAEPEKVLWSFSRGHAGKNKEFKPHLTSFSKNWSFTLLKYMAQSFPLGYHNSKSNEDLFWLPIVWNIQIGTVRPNK